MSILYLFGIARCERYPGTLLKHSFFCLGEFESSFLRAFADSILTSFMDAFLVISLVMVQSYVSTPEASNLPTSGLQQACDMDSVENKRTEVLLCWFHFLCCRPERTEVFQVLLFQPVKASENPQPERMESQRSEISAAQSTRCSTVSDSEAEMFPEGSLVEYRLLSRSSKMRGLEDLHLEVTVCYSPMVRKIIDCCF